MIAVPMLDKTADSDVEAYLSGIISRAGASMVMSFGEWLRTKKTAK